MDMLKLWKVDSYFFLSLTTRRVYSPHILITSFIDKLFELNIDLREFCSFVRSCYFDTCMVICRFFMNVS